MGLFIYQYLLMLIRKAKLADLEILSQMSFDLLRYHQKLNKYFTPAKDAKIFLNGFLRKCVRSKKFCVLVASSGDVIVGYGIAGLSSRPPIFKNQKIGFIYDLYVQEKYRRSGVGKIILLAMYDWFRENDIKDVELSVQAINDSGNSFWDKEGFAAVNVKRCRAI